MKASKLLTTLDLLLVVFTTGAASAQEISRRTLLVVPNQPVEKAPTISVHKEMATTLVFEEAPKAVKLDGAEGRIDVAQRGKLVVLIPLVELKVRERLTLTVTAPDDSRFVLGVMDSFNTEVDGQVTVRRGRAAVEPEPVDGFISLLLKQERRALKEIRFHAKEGSPDAEILAVEGAVTTLDFAIVLVTLLPAQTQNAKVRMRGAGSGELELVDVRPDSDGLLVAVRKPAGEPDTVYRVEVETTEGVTLVSPGLVLWPAATAQRTR